MSALTDEQIDKTYSYINDKWKGKPCPMCDNREWFIPTNSFELKDFRSPALIGGTVLPVIPIICTNCSNTIFINAILSGIVKNEKIQGKESNDGK